MTKKNWFSFLVWNSFGYNRMREIGKSKTYSAMVAIGFIPIILMPIVGGFLISRIIGA